MHKKVACYSPGMESFNASELNQFSALSITEQDLVDSNDFNQALVKVVALTDEQVAHSVDDIDNTDKVSYVRGIPLSEPLLAILDKAGSVLEVSSEVENIKLLQSKRVDHIFGFYPDILFAYDELSVEQPYPFSKEFTPLKVGDSIVCYKQHAQFIEKFNELLNRFRQDGRLQEILQRSYIPE
ncbi:hypothetical protein [Colwellia sp. MEBiC06753]